MMDEAKVNLEYIEETYWRANVGKDHVIVFEWNGEIQYQFTYEAKYAWTKIPSDSKLMGIAHRSSLTSNEGVASSWEYTPTSKIESQLNDLQHLNMEFDDDANSTD